MADYAYPDLAVHGRLVPDDMSDAERAARSPDEQPAPAFELGVEIEGVFIPFLRKRSVGGLIADIQRAAANARASATAPVAPGPVEPPPPPAAPLVAPVEPVPPPPVE